MGYNQPFKKVGKVEPGMKNQSKSGIYQIGAIKSSLIKDLEKSAKSATSNLQQAAFPEGGKGLTSPKPTKTFQFSEGPTPYEVEYQKGAQRIPELTKKYGQNFDAFALRGDDMTRASTDSRGIQSVMNEGGILEQKRKFEKQFGTGSSRMFNFADPDVAISQVRGLRGRAYDRAIADQKKLSSDIYDTNVEMAKNYQKTGSMVNAIKPRGIDTSLGYQTSTPSPKPKKVKKSTGSTRRRVNVLENVGEAIQSLNPFKPRFGPRSRAGRKSTGRRWMKT